MKYDNKLEATQAWVHGFNSIPLEFIRKSCEKGGGSIFDEVDVLATPTILCEDCNAEQSSTNATCEGCGNDLSDTGIPMHELPMWDTVWTFGEKIDEDWALENTDILTGCGFHVYEQEELGVFIGIDGAGESFYKAYWIPLYEKRGLKWHEK